VKRARQAKGARAAVQSSVEERGLQAISGKEWEMLRASLPGVSETTLRKHLLDLGIKIEQPWRGLDTASLDGLEETLLAMTEVYATHARVARDIVIAVKDKARFAARNPKAAAEKRALKSEMVEWMLVWLGDPRMFADWVRLRRAVLRSQLEISPAKPNQP
jgi:hypothetical protein